MAVAAFSRAVIAGTGAACKLQCNSQIPVNLRNYTGKMSKKTAILLLAEGAEEMEAVIAVDVLRRADITVTVASIGDSEVVTCSRKVKICADVKLSEVVESQKFDAVILPGGLAGSDALAKSQDVGKLLASQEKEERLIAAICAAPVAIKAHGIAKGKKLTSYPSMKSKVEEGYEYIDQKVVIDGNLITSKGPATAYAFALAIVEKLLSKEDAVAVASGLLYEDYH